MDNNPKQFCSPKSTPPELIQTSMEFLSRSWSPTSCQITKALSPRLPPRYAASTAPEPKPVEAPLDAATPFAFASPATSQLVLDRILSQSQEATQLTAGRLSHSSPPFSPSQWEDVQDFAFLSHSFHTEDRRTTIPLMPNYREENRTLNKWLKDRKNRKESHAHNAQLHAAVSVAGLAAAVSAIAAATAAATSTEDDAAARTNLAISSAATLVAAQCVEAAEILGAKRAHIAAAVASAVRVRTPGDIVALTTAATLAVTGAASVKTRVFKDMWNIAAVIPLEKGFPGHCGNHTSGDAMGSSENEENFVGLGYQEFLARGAELLQRSRTGALQWKIVSVYIDRSGNVNLKTKSRNVVGIITRKNKNVCELLKDMPAWPGRHLLEGGAERCYFGLKTIEEGVIEFECRGRREYEIWTKGVSQLLFIAGENGRKRV